MLKSMQLRIVNRLVGLTGENGEDQGTFRRRLFQIRIQDATTEIYTAWEDVPEYDEEDVDEADEGDAAVNTARSVEDLGL